MKDNKLDMKTKLTLLLFNLKVDNNYEYSIEECNKKDIYIFNNYNEFEKYFEENGVFNINRDLLKLCILKKTKTGKILALKQLCNHTITKCRLTQKISDIDIDLIHSRGNITPLEKLEEWEYMNQCAPSYELDSVIKRCRYFKNCSECLREFAFSKREYEKKDCQKVLKK